MALGDRAEPAVLLLEMLLEMFGGFFSGTRNFDTGNANMEIHGVRRTCYDGRCE